jgi:2-phospho-L-lactate guanylyltransferase (CobY/MobA/RfbA family)
MPTIVVPFRQAGPKQRLAPASDELALAMLEDLLRACRPVGPTILATEPVGQGRAVAAALADVTEGAVLVVNADLPCVRPRDLLALLGAVPTEGLAVVAARDGTTNALGLSSPGLFRPLYGPGSAERYLALEAAVQARIPNLVDDVDTIADLERLEERVGPRTRAALEALRQPAR